MNVLVLNVYYTPPPRVYGVFVFPPGGLWPGLVELWPCEAVYCSQPASQLAERAGREFC